MSESLLIPTAEGLWCEAGGFHVDPWRPVPLAVITHAHADHATPGCGRYLASRWTLEVMRARFDRHLQGDILEWGAPQSLGTTEVSLHPAGHVLGSAQVCIRHAKETWCVTGDFKCAPDPTCEAFECVPCDTLLTESTFALPIYRWPDSNGVFAEINQWWRDNAARGRTTVLLAYAFGKAQRVLAGLDPEVGPIGIHASLAGPTEVYRQAGRPLPPTIRAHRETAAELSGQGLIICPPAASGTSWIRRFAGPDGLRLGFVSGWMHVRGRRRWQSVDRGFVISDHADWYELVETIRRSGARRVGVTHGRTEVLARYVTEHLGLESFVVPTRYVGEPQPETAARESA